MGRTLLLSPQTKSQITTLIEIGAIAGELADNWKKKKNESYDDVFVVNGEIDASAAASASDSAVVVNGDAATTASVAVSASSIITI